MLAFSRSHAGKQLLVAAPLHRADAVARSGGLAGGDEAWRRLLPPVFADATPRGFAVIVERPALILFNVG